MSVLVIHRYQNSWLTSLFVLQISAAADGHLGYNPALNSAFSFKRTLNLVSISEDGVQLPKIYDNDDLARSTSQGYTAAAVDTIDGIPVIDYLVELSALQTQQDPDSAFNVLFTNIPFNVSGGGSGFTSGSVSGLPDSHTVKFTNGSSAVYENRAYVNQDLTGIDSGDKLHSLVEIPAATPTPAPTPKLLVRDGSEGGADNTTLKALPGYPSPIEIHKGQHVSGYFLNDTAHMDTCVLVLYSFEPKGGASESQPAETDPNASSLEFRRVVRSFFKDCKDANRNKLVIDLSANGGGILFDGFELYRNLFPTAPTYSGTRFRASQALALFGGLIFGSDTGVQIINNVLDSSNKPFPNWASLVGPKVFPQDNETNIMVYDFANGTTVNGPNSSFIVTGYDPADPAPPQPFTAENIIIVTDGYCASTCTVFTGLMAREQGVRTIALGGRPLKAPMQAIGGVKGAQVQKFSLVQQLTAGAIQAAAANVSALGPWTIPSAGPPPLNPVDLSKSAQFNFRNAYTANGTDGPPLQFIYEAANCRRFYRQEYLTDIRAQWRDMADVAWNSAKCAPGSTVNADGTMGTGVLGFSEAVVSTQKAYDGPGSLTDPRWKALAVNTTGVDDITPPGPKSGAVSVAAAGKMGYVLFGGLLGFVLLL